MSRRRVLVLLKPLDVYPPRPSNVAAAVTSSSLSPRRLINPKILNFLDDRCRVHKETINFCQKILEQKCLDWVTLARNNLGHPIRDVDLVITVGGDGTLLQASHFLDDSIPILGVNSDPTQVEEVSKFIDDFDATRSTGYLCAATAQNFQQVLSEILEGHKQPSELSRISTTVNGGLLATHALNDILIAHPCPAAVSRFSFRVESNSTKSSTLANCRSSGLRVCTAAGSTAAMLSAGGFPMPLASPDLQYMVREPILHRSAEISLMSGVIRPDQSMRIVWYSQEGVIYFDGSNATHPVQHGDIIEVSNRAPLLKVYLNDNMPRDIILSQ